MRTQKELRSNDWFYPVPDGWEMKPIKSLFTFTKGLDITKADLTDAGEKVVNYGEIHSKGYLGTGITKDVVRYVSTQTLKSQNASLIRRGGFAFADTSEDLAGVGNCAYNDSDEALHGGYHTIVLNPRQGDNNKFLAYQFRTDAWRQQLRRQLVDVKVFSVNQGILSETYVVLPPEEIQRKIVHYLDVRCAAIDAEISRLRAIIEKLREYKKSVIAHVVTKGLEQNAPMRDSGIDWIGEIPMDWAIHYPKSLFAVRNERVREGDVQLTASQTYGIIPQATFQEIEGRRVVQVILNPEILKHVEVGDFVMHMRSFQGGLEFAEQSGCISSAYVMLHRRSEDVRNRYFKYLFKSSAYIDALRSTSNLIRDGQALRYANFNQVYLPLPPASVQEEIADRLDERCASIDEVISRQQQLIDRLEEYRTSVIHHAVTGNIDCMEVKS